MSQPSYLQRHPLLKHLLLMLLASVAILVVVFLLIKVYARQGKEYVLPDMVGLNVADLHDENPLELNFVVLDSVYRPGQVGGSVIAQTPKPGTKVKKARKIYLTVTTFSPEQVGVPDLVDLSLRQAVSAIESAGLQVGRLTFVPSQFNVVLEQSSQGRICAKGDQLPMDSRIDLTVGLGEKETTAVVPFVIGKNARKAHNAIFRASLNVGREHWSGVKDQATAVVVRQEPDYTGVSRYDFGTPVELWYQDANTLDVQQLVRDFKVDSSKIVRPTASAEAQEGYLEW